MTEPSAATACDAAPPRGMPGVLRSAGGTFANTAMRSMMWLLGQTAASRTVQAAAQIALAWLLVPADFGQISLALTVVNLGAAAFQLGLDDVVLHRNRAMPLWFGTVFWLSLATALSGTLLLLGIAPLAAHLYGQPELVGLIAVLALALPFRSLSAVPNTIIRGRLDFRLLSLIGFCETLAGSVLSILLAAANFGAYSIVLPTPLLAVLSTLVMWRVARTRRPRLLWNRRWMAIVPRSTAVLASRLLIALVGHGDYIVLGLVASQTRIGLYYFAYRIAGQPMRLLAGSVTHVLFPTLVRFGDDPSRQRQAVLLASRILAIAVMPVCFLQAALAGPFLSAFFQTQWSGAETFIQLLSIGLAFDAVSWTVGALLPARGEFGVALRYITVTTGLFFAFVVAGAWLGQAEGVAIGVAAYYVIVQPCFCLFVFRRTGPITLSTVAGIYLAPAVLGAITAFGSAWLVREVGSPLLQLIVAPTVALAAYAVCIRYAAPEPCRYIVARFQALWAPT